MTPQEIVFEAADVFVNAVGWGLGEHLTCREANAVAELLKLTHGDDTAAAFLSDHAVSDDQGDEHYTLRECRHCGGTMYHNDESWVCQECPEGGTQ